MTYAKGLTLLALAGFLALPVKHAAQAADNGNNTVNVEADQMEIIDADHKTIFRGNVIAKRPTDTIKADEMTVSSSEEKQPDGTSKTVTDTVDAKGNVTINTKSATVTGDWAKFDVVHDQLVVGGQVQLTQGTSVLRGQKANIDLKTNHVQMSGGRVNGSFLPQ
jgi:lipopolysaccharide export system protein LptA